MGYAEDVLAIMTDLKAQVDALSEFVLVDLGYTSAIGNHQNIPSCMIVFTREPLRESAGAQAEMRDLFVEFWMLNRESHEKALEHAGLIVDMIDADKTLGNKVRWSTLFNVETFIKPEKGYNLNWGKVTYRFERRRLR